MIARIRYIDKTRRSHGDTARIPKLGCGPDAIRKPLFGPRQSRDRSCCRIQLSNPMISGIRDIQDVLSADRNAVGTIKLCSGADALRNSLYRSCKSRDGSCSRIKDPNPMIVRVRNIHDARRSHGDAAGSIDLGTSPCSCPRTVRTPYSKRVYNACDLLCRRIYLSNLVIKRICDVEDSCGRHGNAVRSIKSGGSSVSIRPLVSSRARHHFHNGRHPLLNLSIILPKFAREP